MSVSRGPLGVPPAPGPRRRRDEEVARAVLEAAVQLLDDGDVGLRGLTVSAVARRAGVARATVYRWWPNKAHLALDAYRAKSARDTVAKVTGDLRADLRAHLGHLAFALGTGSARAVAEITLAAASDPTFGRLYRSTLLHERRRAVLDVLEAGRRRGQVRVGVDLAVAVDAAYGALHHRLLLSGEPLDGPFVTALTDLLVAGVATACPAPPRPPAPA